MTLRSRSAGAVAMAAFCVYALWMWHTRSSPFHTLLDYQGFYCASRALLAHQNPYLYGPLHVCETAISPGMAPYLGPLVVPGPLPPYALALLAPLAILPWGISAPLWFCILSSSIVATAIILARLSGMPFPIALLVVGLPESVSLPVGNLAPLPIFLIVLCAYATAKRRWYLAIGCAALATLAPNLVLGVVMSILIFVPAARVGLVCVGLAFVGIDIAAGGVSLSQMYLHQVLPVHALVEVSNLQQLSLTHLLFLAHVSARSALSIGSVQFVVLLLAGLVLGARFAARYGAEWLILTPAAFAVAGGSYVHYSELALAVPFVVCLAARTNDNIAKLAVLVLTVPWAGAFGMPNLPIAAASLFALASYFWPERRGLGVAIAAVAVWFSVLVGYSTFALDGEAIVRAHAALRTLPTPSANSIPESNSTLFLNMPLPHPWIVAAPLLVTDVGLLLMIWVSVRIAATRQLPITLPASAPARAT